MIYSNCTVTEKMEINVYFNDYIPSIFKELRDLRSRNIKLWIKEADYKEYAKYKIRDINLIKHESIDNSLRCFKWDIESETTTALDEYKYDGLKHLVSRCASYDTLFVCIDNEKHCGNQLVLFQDAKHKIEYPKEFIKIHCYNNWDDFYHYLSAQDIFAFSLKDETKFVKCADINPVQGSIVYKEKATGHYWYLDNLHKTHYEVFDAAGKKHIGEADLEGNIDCEKADKKKAPLNRDCRLIPSVIMSPPAGSPCIFPVLTHLFYIFGFI